MGSSSLEELERTLVDLRLVALDELQRALSPPDESARTAEVLLNRLQKAGLLTPYQVEKLLAGETDELVVGGYKLLYRNAAGTFARVFRACSLEDGRTVALKLLRRRWCDDRETVAAFRREAEIGLRLHHPNIVRIFDVGVHEAAGRTPRPYFTMEFVEGGHLRDFVNTRGRLSAGEAVRCVRDIASALDHALQRGVCHGDLKMTNVLMSADGVPKLIDFGVASPSGRAAEAPRRRQTVEYATLEKGTGAPPGDPRTDLFFLGAILYELLAGEPPFPPTKDYDERALLSRYSNVRPIRQLVPELSPRLAEVVDRLMHLNPNERYQTPAEVIPDLTRVLRELSPEQSQIAGGGGQDAAGERATVLVIENRPKLQDAMRKLLSDAGFRVLILGDWHRAVRRLQEAQPECTIVVASALGAEAARACSQVAQVAVDNQTAVVVVLSSKQESLRKSLPRAPNICVLTQPIDAARLLDCVRHCVKRSSEDRP
ncbi:MAG: protein kinase [Planctomycetes bacterium]|nr:protein kinase [Planctomycetota bacterium]